MAQLQDLLQTHGVVQILDFLTLYKDFEYTKTDIAKETGLSRRTLYQIWHILEEFDLVKITKESGAIKFYKLNTENPIARHLILLEDIISFYCAEKISGVKILPAIKNVQAKTEENKVTPIRVTYEKYTIEGQSTVGMKELIDELDFRNSNEKTIALPDLATTDDHKPLQKVADTSASKFLVNKST